MSQDPKKHTKNTNTRPDAANDQLGENAALEFSQDYEDKSNPKTKHAGQNQ
jgi:hypothetical protein